MNPSTVALAADGQVQADVLGWLRAPAAGAGLRTAGPDGFGFLPYDQLAEQIRALAVKLTAIEPGDVVALAMPNGPSFVTALLAAMLVGGAPAPLPPPRFGQNLSAYADVFAARLRAVRPRLVLTEPRLRDLLTPTAGAVGVPLACAADLPRALDLARVRNLPEALNGGTVPAPVRLALVQFTSGSTGAPRPVQISHTALAANVAAIGAWLRIGPGDATASWLPACHDMGLIGCLLTPLAHGSDLWLMSPEQFLRDPVMFLRCFGERGATMTAMPPFGLDHVLRRVRPEQLRTMNFEGWRTLIVGAQRITASVLDRFAQALGPYGFAPEALRPAYGLAEATLAVTGLPHGARWSSFPLARQSLLPGQPVASVPAAADPLVGCGVPLDQVMVTICAEDGTALPERSLGQIVVSGPAVTAGYRADDVPGAASRVADDRLFTGDLGFIHGGQLFVVGRGGDSVKVRGRSVFADDVEAAMQDRQMPGHRLAVALGYAEEGPTAVLVLEGANADEVTVARAVLGRIADGARTEVILAPRGTIPRTPSGKPCRAELWRGYRGGALDSLPRAAGGESADLLPQATGGAPSDSHDPALPESTNP